MSPRPASYVGVALLAHLREIQSDEAGHGFPWYWQREGVVEIHDHLWLINSVGEQVEDGFLRETGRPTCKPCTARNAHI